MTGDRIRFAESAIIALDDAYREQQWEPGLMLQRAQVLATLASAEQARVANLIAYKALRQSQSATALPTSGDAVTDEIEQLLGLLDPMPEPTLAEILAERTTWAADVWAHLIDASQTGRHITVTESDPEAGA